MNDKKRGSQVIRGCLIGVLLLASGGLALSQQRGKPAGQASVIPEKVRPVLDSISADSLRGNLAFLASDLLEGRNTPSRGLDLAAEYIASQFMRAGVEPAVEPEPGGDGRKSYFQVAKWQVTEPALDAFELTVRDGEQMLSIPVRRISYQGEQAVDLRAAPLLRLAPEPAAISALTPGQLKGMAVITELPEIPRGADRTRMMEVARTRNQLVSQLVAGGAALILSINRTSPVGRGLAGGRLIDPSRSGSTTGGPRGDGVLTVHDQRLVAIFDSMNPGESRGTVTLRLAPPTLAPVELRNVIGIVRGSDPVLRETCVIVSAHYDHVGVMPGTPGDNIYNGANDDASGTVSVIELASAIARMKVKPKRSLVFIAWFGEEKGLLGSRYYGRNPVFPLAKTVAMVNLEQVGRTDSSEGPQISNATLTGFDFTDLGPIFSAAGRLTGINVYKHEQNSDAFFGRSDNQALADAGIPAHTLCTAFVYPDYHQASDHWDRIDYDNMARVNRMVALALVTIADNPQAPRWNEANPKTSRYVAAWKKLQELP